MTEDCLKPGGADQPSDEDDIAAQATMYRFMVENTLDIIIRYDAARVRTYISPSSRDVLGYEPAEMLGQNASTVIHPNDFPRIEPTFREVGPARPSLVLCFRAMRKDGTWIWIEGQYRYLPQDSGYLAVLRDITARKHAEDMLAAANAKLEAANCILQTLAQKDGLTGLANRRRFDELLGEEFRRARRLELPLGVVLLDVDCFKAYNDRYGHIAGDECLRRISRAIEGVLGRPGDHAARYGGEEFAVILPATDHGGTMIAAERMRAAVLALGLEHLGSAYGVATISAGAGSMIPFGGGDDPVHLVDAADRALYQAKSDGRNRVRGGVEAGSGGRAGQASLGLASPELVCPDPASIS